MHDFHDVHRIARLIPFLPCVSWDVVLQWQVWCLLSLTFTLPTSATKGGWLPPILRFGVRFKILYRVIQPLIQHCLLRKMVYLNIIYVIATRNYDFFTTGIVP